MGSWRLKLVRPNSRTSHPGSINFLGLTGPWLSPQMSHSKFYSELGIIWTITRNFQDLFDSGSWSNRHNELSSQKELSRLKWLPTRSICLIQFWLRPTCSLWIICFGDFCHHQNRELLKRTKFEQHELFF